MSSVSAVQHADPRPRAPNASSARGGDPFSEILENVAGARRERQEALNGADKDAPPTAAEPGVTSRTEALERGETPTCANAKEGCDGRDHAAQGSDDAAAADTGEGEPSLTLAAEAIEVTDEEVPSLETAGTEEVDATGEELPEANADAETADPCESDAACAAQSAQSQPADDVAIEIAETTESAEPEPDAEPIPVEAEGDMASDVPGDAVETEPADNAAPVEEAPVAVADTAAPATANSVAAAIEQAADGVETVPPVQPGNAPKSPPGLEHAPGQQPVHPNPVAAAARENAPPFSGEGDAHQHPQHPEHPQQAQNPSHAQEAKAAAPGQMRAAETAQPSAPQPEAPAPIQIDPNLSAASHQSARPLSANFDPAILQPVSTGSAEPVPLTGNAIAVEIVSRMRDGLRRFDIRLDPPELGRIEVRLDVDRHGQVTTRLTVDRPETLELMQREARGLERALQQAGLKTDEGGLQFSLRQQSDNFTQAEHRSGRNPDLPADEIELAGSAIESYRAAIFARGGVDIRV